VSWRFGGGLEQRIRGGNVRGSRCPAPLVLAVHAQPGAKRTDVAGLHGDAVTIRAATPLVEGTALV
jgi:hypothetical protein